VRTRDCDSPRPEHGGLDCVGDASEPCNTEACPPGPVNGGWGNWTDCTATCGGGTQTRECDAPAPAHGGLTCEDQENIGLGSRECNTQHCPIDGQWGEWGLCSEPCGGTGVHFRECNDPAPQYDGIPCIGKSEEYCNFEPCQPTPSPTPEPVSAPATTPSPTAEAIVIPDVTAGPDGELPFTHLTAAGNCTSSNSVDSTTVMGMFEVKVERDIETDNAVAHLSFMWVGFTSTGNSASLNVGSNQIESFTLEEASGFITNRPFSFAGEDGKIVWDGFVQKTASLSLTSPANAQTIHQIVCRHYAVFNDNDAL
jgi:hypothetical protein